ncbi:hypothetical protein [Plasticicumulans sp.]|uniref:hypothetical protein n=1 Tax=Plasticicumulans sp. TaxID=2307179 RepID=UPI000F94B8D1|nr:hypothetical protein [Plasticicumulans sp.]MBS0602964.1 hypothetical protein [Pseudomonadota bacterium]RTK96225.1 MAG: hypothetical protein EKK65_14270 [Xanthomonadales bacterium]HMW31274.1 hypothetical protein [Plasticicumulans sp.]HMW43880.1 hypothetical protein [Plasticicumulans sp.]HMX54699.1 hypothetical protein [Plasticicumulans sp.]
MKTENTPVGKVLRASESRRAAGMLNIGNIVAILLPVPLLIFWFGASMLVYAMNRHHPDKRVGHYTQQAAYRLYGVTGFFTAAATFIPGGGWTWYIVAWVAAALVLIPWSVLDLRRIRREDWADIILPEPRTA